MRAAYYKEQGAIDNIRVGEFSDHRTGEDDILIRVRSASLNGFDPMMVLGTTELKTPLPMIPLGDCAGEVAEVGTNVTGFKPGDRVLPFPYVLGEGMTGETRLGCAAEFALYPAVNLMKLPDSVSFDHAACIPIAYGTAYRMVVQRGQVREGERVLILGASGGVGIGALQLAKSAGCEVIACAGSAEKLDVLEKLGADMVIDTSRQDFLQEVRSRYGKPRVMGGGGVDVVVNYLGGDTWTKSLQCLAKGGRMLVCGATAGYETQVDVRYLWSFEQSILGSDVWLPGDQLELVKMVASGKLTPYIQQSFPLEGTATAIQKLYDRQVVGKLIVNP